MRWVLDQPWLGGGGQGVALLTGMVLGFGVVALVAGLRRTNPRLSDALSALDADPLPSQAYDLTARSASERLGVWAFRRSPVPLTAGQLRLLELQRKSVAEFFADKLVLAVIGAVLPGVAAALFAWGPAPVVAALAGAVAGWFTPDLLLRRATARVQVDAQEALFTFFDLVILERLANRSAIQALQTAARVSDNALFRSIRSALDRAHLEQRPPYDELRRLAERLRLPQLGDIADVMQLDESGAAVSDALRARVEELRDAHLAESRRRAHAVSESMTLWMALPALIFGLIFLIPPLMRLVG